VGSEETALPVVRVQEERPSLLVGLVNRVFFGEQPAASVDVEVIE
jgi:hypothetical protein